MTTSGIANPNMNSWQNFNLEDTTKGETFTPISLKQNDKNIMTNESRPTRNLNSSRDDKIILEKHEENEENKQEADDNMNTSASLQNTVQQNASTKLRGEMSTSTKEANKPDLLNNNTTTSDTIIMEPQKFYMKYTIALKPIPRRKGS